MSATYEPMSAQTLAVAAAAGLIAGIACASSPPVDKTDAAPAEAGKETLEVALPPVASAPPSDLTAVTRDEPPPAATARRDKNCCKGMNECKGKGMCKTDNNDCKGLNECKARGGCKPPDC